MPAWIQQAHMAKQHGQPPPPPPLTSSVAVDADWDYHQPEFDKVQEWLSSPARFEEERRGNRDGIQNVKLHGMQHKAQLDKFAQANAPKPEPPRVNLSAEVKDPSVIAQWAAETGAQTTPQNIQAADQPDDQNKAADTQLKAASAQHKSVLAAREAGAAGVAGVVAGEPGQPMPSVR